MSTLEDSKVVLVTGSSSSIGASIALQFAKRGFKVAVTGGNRERVESIAKQCTNQSPQGFKAFSTIADLSDTYNGEVIVRQTVDHFGRLDVLINNVGAYVKTHAADKTSLASFKKTMAINVESVVHTTTESIPHLEATKGNIIFVSSFGSIKPAANEYAYRMSKAALLSYAKCLAIDVAPKIRVNIVIPGHTFISPSSERTSHKEHPLGQVTSSDRENEEIASTIYYLASDEASFVNGSELYVDGRRLIKDQINNS